MPGDKVIFSSFCKLGFPKTALNFKNANDSHCEIAFWSGWSYATASTAGRMHDCASLWIVKYGPLQITVFWIASESSLSHPPSAAFPFPWHRCFFFSNILIWRPQWECIGSPKNADEVREVESILYRKSVGKVDKGEGVKIIRKFCRCYLSMAPVALFSLSGRIKHRWLAVRS